MADAVWLASYPATYVGLALLLRERLRTWRATLWLDGVIGGLTAGAVDATLVFGPVLAATEGDPAAVGVTLAHPLADLTQVLFVVAAFGVLGWRPGRSWSLLGLGLVVIAVAGALYVFRTPPARTSSGRGSTRSGRPARWRWRRPPGSRRSAAPAATTAGR